MSNLSFFILISSEGGGVNHLVPSNHVVGLRASSGHGAEEADVFARWLLRCQGQRLECSELRGLQGDLYYAQQGTWVESWSGFDLQTNKRCFFQKTSEPKRFLSFFSRRELSGVW